MSKIKFKKGISILPVSPGRYRIYYPVNGKPVWETVDAANYREASNIRDAKKVEARKQQPRPGAVIDLVDAFKLLMKKIENQVELGAVDRKTISNIRTRFQRFFFDYPRHLGVEWKTMVDFGVKDFDNYRNYYGITLGRKQGLSSEMRTLKRIFSYLKEEGWIVSQKLIELREVKCPPKNFTPLIPNPDEDFEKLFVWFNKNDPRSFDFNYFLIRTARRPGLVRELLRENTKLDKECIYTPKEKHKEESWIPLDDLDLKKIVTRAMEVSRKLDSPYLFVNKHGRQFSKSNPIRVFKAAAAACGISNWEKWTPYQLKKYMLTKSFNKNLPSEKISVVSGHKNLDSVKPHYYQPDRHVSGEVYEASKLRVNI